MLVVKNKGEGGPHTRTGNSLSVSLILNITGGVDTLNVGHRSAVLGDNVPIGVRLQLALDKCRGRVVANGVEKTVGLQRLLLAALDVLDHQVAHEALFVTLDLNTDRVPLDGDILVVLQPLGHDVTGTERIPADEHGNVAGVLGQEDGLLGGRVTTTNHDQRLFPEDGRGTIADGTGGDTAVPVLVLTGQTQTAGSGAGGNDDGIGGVLGIGVPLGRVLEGAFGEVELGDGLGDDFCAEALGLLAHVVHQLAAEDSIGEAGKVLDVGGGGQLATGGGAVGHEAFVEGRLEIGAGQVDGGRVGSGPRADNETLGVSAHLGGGAEAILKVGKARLGLVACGSESSYRQCFGTEAKRTREKSK